MKDLPSDYTVTVLRTFFWVMLAAIIRQAYTESDRVEIVGTRTTSMLSIESVETSDQGSYTCTASNGQAEDRSTAQLIIEGAKL
ncbi:titin-like [Tropilaelaps mercedesae]|uniref:Titin-like n=1 Tax=Tropilaelaps mercedesae TaxID=418985 RepID=A0A1V9XN42_9ACAR|nr:titin-like [Tropilaelaps mercedesae]